jgi:hypothetical protein
VIAISVSAILFFIVLFAASRDFSSLRTQFQGVAYCIRLLYVDMAYVKNAFYADVFLVYKIYCFQPA